MPNFTALTLGISLELRHQNLTRFFSQQSLQDSEKRLEVSRNEAQEIDGTIQFHLGPHSKHITTSKKIG